MIIFVHSIYIIPKVSFFSLFQNDYSMLNISKFKSKGTFLFQNFIWNNKTFSITVKLIALKINLTNYLILLKSKFRIFRITIYYKFCII